MKIKRTIRFLFQRIFRGWTDKETWSLERTIAKFVLPRLKRFKELNFGYPYNFTMDTWDEALDKMIFSFEKVSRKYEEEYDIETLKKIDEGLELFSKHFHDLWW